MNIRHVTPGARPASRVAAFLPVARAPSGLSRTLLASALMLALSPATWAQTSGGQGGQNYAPGGNSGQGGGAISSGILQPGANSSNGDGGNGGNGTVPGGAGGSVNLYVTNSDLAVGGTLVGDDGSVGTSTAIYGHAGGGGGGGAGVYISGTVNLINQSTIGGGNGGDGGVVDEGTTGGGGGGGNGVSAYDVTIQNYGTITGGNGGAGGSGTYSSAGSGGGGGNGIAGSNLTIINSGTISGGAGGAGGVDNGNSAGNGAAGTNGDAILFTGGINTLTMAGGSLLNGAVEALQGALVSISGTGSGTIFNKLTTVGAGQFLFGPIGVGAVNDNAATTLYGNVITQGGGQIYGSSASLTLGSNVTLSDTNGGDIIFDSPINGAQNLAVSTMGNVSFQQSAGATTALTGLVVQSGSASFAAPLQVSGSLSISTTIGSISQSAAWNVGGMFSINAGSNAITLTNANNSFASGMYLYGSDITIAAASNLSFGTVAASGTFVANGTGNMSVGEVSAAKADLSTSGSILVTGDLLTSQGTTFSATSLQIGNGSTYGSITGNVVDNSTLIWNRSNDVSYGDVISGSGQVLKQGAGVLTLDGNSSAFGGTTDVQAGTLIVGSVSNNGAALGGNVSVESGATLGGNGAIGGSVSLASGSTLSAGAASQIGTLTVNGDLTIDSGSTLNFDFGAPGPNFSTPGQSDHVAVNGNLSIGQSTLNVNNLGSMGPGLYNLFTWGNTLSITGGGFAPPAGMSLQVLTIDKQINLIDTQNVTLNEWDANGLAGPGSMGGGSGTWSVTSGTWSDTTGQYIGPMAPQPGFAIFGGAAGVVTVDGTNGAVSATGLQFVTDGYVLIGDSLDLVAQNSVAPVIRVSSGATAVIDNSLDGVAGFNKTDGGTLELNGVNIYTGNTVLSGGELSVSSDLNLGSASSALDFEGGTLQVTGNVFHSTNRQIIWGNAGGGFDIADASNVFTVSQNLSGTGGLYKTGAGTLVLSGNNSFTGGTTIAQGTLQANTTSLMGDVVDNATLSFVQASDGTFNGAISGSGQLVKSGTGTLTLGGANTYSGGTLISQGALQGTTSSLQGGVTDNGVLIFDQSVDGAFAGAISGTGQLVKNGTGNVTLAQGNSYTGGTLINSGTLTGDTGSLQGNIINNATMVFAQNADGVSAGTISGTGQLIKNGTGVLSLTGGNTYSGGTTINAGTLQGDTTSLQGDMLDNATLTFAQSSNGTFAGAVSGTGQLIKSGTGTLTLSGVNTYGGGTLIAAGALQGTTSSVQGAVTNNAALIFDQASDGTFAGAISGTGQLVKNGAGNVTLAQANSYTGGTLINGGTLTGDVGSLQGNITNNATVVFAQNVDAAFSGVISGAGQLIKSGSGVLSLTGINTYTGGTTVNAGTLQGDTSSINGAVVDNATLVFAQQSNGIFNGTLGGSGQLVKNGSGTLVLDGANSFSGNTEVAAGKLVVGDDTHAGASLAGTVSVDGGATLGGIGSIGGLDLAGTLTPGNSIGTLNVLGDATFRPGSSYQFEVAPDGSSDRLAATGAVTIQGGSALALASNGNWSPVTSMQIITAGGGISGQFDSIQSNLAFLTPSLSYGANAVTLQMERNDIQFADVAQTKNQRAVASSIDALGMASPIYSAVVSLDAATARAGFDAMSGEQFASTRSALIDDSHYVRDAIDRHLLGLSNDGTQATNAQGVTAWTSAWGHWGSSDSDGNAARMNADGSGLLVGADLGVGSDARLGAVVGHSQLTTRVDDRGSDAHVLGTNLGLYGDVSWGAFALRGGVAYAWQQVNSHRNLAFGNLTDALSDRYDAHVAQGFVEGGYRFQVTPGQQVEPFLNLAHVQVQTDASREASGIAALTVASQSDAVNIATLGVRDTWSLGRTGGLNAHIGIGWQQAWGDVTPVSTVRFTSGSDSFDIAGTPVARHAGVIDGGLSFAVARNAFVDASYIGRFGDGAKDQGARLSLNVLW
ncbi:autotransporter-associated beta strand repeat-containing protein [Dyella sp. C11]|uniref:autotransporter-associated beta strand repeat-containing protein n=1 Tax=Dyella sp. C11 TaxID=2126991 RepID=UPI000D64AF82|nr:autotransporter-associated beta strand repeat-containing protein [Dyella sp. C11]